MDWCIDVKQMSERYHFKTGIINYLPAGGIEWVNTKELNGISSFEELAKILKME